MKKFYCILICIIIVGTQFGCSKSTSPNAISTNNAHDHNERYTKIIGYTITTKETLQPIYLIETVSGIYPLSGMQKLVYQIRNDSSKASLKDIRVSGPITRNNDYTDNCGTDLLPGKTCNLELIVDPHKKGYTSWDFNIKEGSDDNSKNIITISFGLDNEKIYSYPIKIVRKPYLLINKDNLTIDQPSDFTFDLSLPFVISNNIDRQTYSTAPIYVGTNKGLSKMLRGDWKLLFEKDAPNASSYIKENYSDGTHNFFILEDDSKNYVVLKDSAQDNLSTFSISDNKMVKGIRSINGLFFRNSSNGEIVEKINLDNQTYTPINYSSSKADFIGSFNSKDLKENSSVCFPSSFASVNISNNAGDEWYKLGIEGFDSPKVLVAQCELNNVYAGTDKGLLIGKINSSLDDYVWTQPDTLKDKTIKGIYTNNKDNEIWVATEDKLYFSFDNGKKWDELSLKAGEYSMYFWTLLN